MLSTMERMKDKSLQGQNITSELKDTSVSMKKLITDVSLTVKMLDHTTTNNNETKESCEWKVEQNNLQKSGEQEMVQMQNVSVLLEGFEANVEKAETKNEQSISLCNAPQEVVEVKVEEAEKEDEEPKSLSEVQIVKTEAEAENDRLENFCDSTTNEIETAKLKSIPIIDKSEPAKPSNVAVPRKHLPPPPPPLNERPLVLTTHLVPSLPINLFEVLVEAIEVATERPVVLLYESRSDRPVANEVTDIAILPASGVWENGKLLPASFCFKHHLNKTNSSRVYADIVLAADRATHIQDIINLRGHRCSLPDRKKNIGTAALLFRYLRTRGESPVFFGNILDADTQLAALQMVAGKQTELGILESPVITCHKNTLPGINSLHILKSLGPLPPYRIMVRKTLPDAIVERITDYLLDINQDKEWMDKFAPFGITGFTENSEKLYELAANVKPVVTSVPYY